MLEAIARIELWATRSLRLSLHEDGDWQSGMMRNAIAVLLLLCILELKPHFKNWNKGLWGDQSYYASSGGAPIEVLEEYIQNHSRGSGTIQPL